MHTENLVTDYNHPYHQWLEVMDDYELEMSSRYPSISITFTEEPIDYALHSEPYVLLQAQFTFDNNEDEVRYLLDKEYE